MGRVVVYSVDFWSGSSLSLGASGCHDDDHLLKAKEGYLNVPFFFVRAGFYFLVWYFLSNRFYKNSVKQDQSGEETLSIRSHRMSTYGVILFAITVTFSSIDWVMSLTPHWYSTMWGVYTVAGAAVGSLALISLAALILRRLGYLQGIISTEHFHDIGKFMYGFNVFWAYIAFSQYFLIWYTNIPEESIWFIRHFSGTWNFVGIFLAVGHFAIPFFLFMSRHAKRNLSFHALMVVWMLFVHYIDIYWVIMPNLHRRGFVYGWVDFFVLVGLGGLFVAGSIWTFSKASLYPLKDPRLSDSLHLEVY